MVIKKVTIVSDILLCILSCKKYYPCKADPKLFIDILCVMYLGQELKLVFLLGYVSTIFTLKPQIFWFIWIPESLVNSDVFKWKVIYFFPVIHSSSESMSVWLLIFSYLFEFIFIFILVYAIRKYIFLKILVSFMPLVLNS